MQSEKTLFSGGDGEIQPEVPTSPVDSFGRLVSPRQNVMFESMDKGTCGRLPSRISSAFQSPFSFIVIIGTTEIYYINGYGMQIHPDPNPEFLSNIASRDILVYSCGSLWTRYFI